ncbi:hypothetical protein [Terracidiphilus sp.]|jgi:hypothetical protein
MLAVLAMLRIGFVADANNNTAQEIMAHGCRLFLPSVTQTQRNS